VPRDRTTICGATQLTIACVLFALSVVSLRAQPKPASEYVERIVALDPRWTVSFDNPPAAPPGYDQQMGYVALKGGNLLAIDLDRGAVAWKAALATTFTPATGDGLVFAAGEGELIALDQRTGQAHWRTPLDARVAGPLYWDSGWLLVSTEKGELVALDGQDGQIAWRVALESPLAVLPTTAGDRVYAALHDGRIVALDLATGALAWTVALGEAVTGMRALNDQLLVGSRADRLHSLSLDRGRRRWTQKAGADVAGGPIADEERIYFTAFDNVVRALDVQSGNLKWLRGLPSRPAGGPLRADNVVLVPLVTTDIAAFDAASGAPAFTIRAVGELGAVPFLREGPRLTTPRLIAMSREGALQGFAARFEPPLKPLEALPGIPVKPGW
jgi:outer membrane protein assembly factor BamB